jgi:8-oxo-dGTP pyrophosphatase MutT (NUDIX family)
MKTYFPQIIDQIQARLCLPLPGEESQFLMAPFRRQRLSDLNPQPSPRPSAVLILLYQDNDGVRLILTQRQEYEGVHGGQVSFPGGRMDPEDRDLEDTALRETFEEIGIPGEKISIIGKLTDLYINPSNFLVSPYVGFLSGLPEFRPSAREVKKVITYPLLGFADEKLRAEKIIRHSSGYQIKTPYFEVEGLTVWGATAMIISELNAVVKEAISS